MEGKSQEQLHNVVTIKNAIVSRRFMVCKEYSWKKVLVGGSETGSRPSRKCKSMQLISDISVSNVMSHSFHLNRVVPESTHGVQRQEKHTGSLHAFAMFFQVTMWTKCFLQLIIWDFIPLQPVNAAFSLEMMPWPQVRLCYIRRWMAEANPRFQDSRFDFSSLRYSNCSCTRLNVFV